MDFGKIFWDIFVVVEIFLFIYGVLNLGFIMVPVKKKGINMLNFVKEWFREKAENAVIEKDGTANKWTKCSEGLPCSDRKVQVIVYTSRLEGNADPEFHCATFNPHVGWNLSGCRGVVVAWKDLDPMVRDLLSDFDLVKKLTR